MLIYPRSNNMLSSASVKVESNMNDNSQKNSCNNSIEMQSIPTLAEKEEKVTLLSPNMFDFENKKLKLKQELLHRQNSNLEAEIN